MSAAQLQVELNALLGEWRLSISVPRSAGHLLTGYCV